MEEKHTAMTAAQVATIVDTELEACEALDNWHGITLENVHQHKVVPPVLRTFADGSSEELLKLWIVIDECPGDERDGYLVVFNETNRLYGLATKRAVKGPGPVFIGYYGNLIETLDAM